MKQKQMRTTALIKTIQASDIPLQQKQKKEKTYKATLHQRNSLSLLTISLTYKDLDDSLDHERR